MAQGLSGGSLGLCPEAGMAQQGPAKGQRAGGVLTRGLSRCPRGGGRGAWGGVMHRKGGS